MTAECHPSSRNAAHFGDGSGGEPVHLQAHLWVQAMPGVVNLLCFRFRDLLTTSTGEQFANTREPAAVGQGEIGTFADR